MKMVNETAKYQQMHADHSPLTAEPLSLTAHVRLVSLELCTE